MSTRKIYWHDIKPRFRPILGAGISSGMTADEFFSKVCYPVYASPKLDGIRALTVPWTTAVEHISLPVCRSMLEVPNRHIWQAMGTLPPGLDGEIVTIEPGDLLDRTDAVKPFYKIQSDVMSAQGKPLFQYHVFDYHYWNEQYPHLETYEKRLIKLQSLQLPDWVKVVDQVICRSREQIEAYEAKCVEQGYEGICWRWVHSPYKYGRSTLKQQYLIKMKRFETLEAEIIGTYEEMQNQNPTERNALGYQERSSHQDNMVGKNRLGGFECTCEQFAESFKVGSGFDASQREELWTNRDRLVGHIITFKYQPHGGKDRPRTPIFKALRDARDLS